MNISLASQIRSIACCADIAEYRSEVGSSLIISFQYMFTDKIRNVHMRIEEDSVCLSIMIAEGLSSFYIGLINLCRPRLHLPHLRIEIDDYDEDLYAVHSFDTQHDIIDQLALFINEFESKLLLLQNILSPQGEYSDEAV